MGGEIPGGGCPCRTVEGSSANSGRGLAALEMLCVQLEGGEGGGAPVEEDRKGGGRWLTSRRSVAVGNAVPCTDFSGRCVCKGEICSVAHAEREKDPQPVRFTSGSG